MKRFRPVQSHSQVCVSIYFLAPCALSSHANFLVDIPPPETSTLSLVSGQEFGGGWSGDSGPETASPELLLPLGSAVWGVPGGRMVDGFTTLNQTPLLFHHQNSIKHGLLKEIGWSFMTRFGKGYVNPHGKAAWTHKSSRNKSKKDSEMRGRLLDVQWIGV